MDTADSRRDFARQAMLDYGLQASLRRMEEGVETLSAVELRFDILSAILCLASGDWYNWVTGNPPRWLLENVNVLDEFQITPLARAVEAVLYFHAPPEDYLKPWDTQSDWEEHLGDRTGDFECPETDTPLPEALRGRVGIGEFGLTDDNPSMDGALAEHGFTPGSWLAFKEEVEAGRPPERYEEWYKAHRGHVEGAGHCLRLLTFDENGRPFSDKRGSASRGWLSWFRSSVRPSFARERWVALPNPFNGFNAASTVLEREEEHLVARATDWVHDHWKEVRIFDPNNPPITPPE